MDDQNKNLLLATVLSALVILIWFVAGPMLFPTWFPTNTPNLNALPAETTAAPAAPATTTTAPNLTATPEPEAPRLTVDTPKLSGSISMLGGRIDDLSLKTYHETVDPKSPMVRLLSPVGKDKPYYAVFGFSPGNGLTAEDVPGAKTEWKLTKGGTLSVGQPVTLSWENGKGLTFNRTIAVDKDFMFTVTDNVVNAGTTEARLAPYGIIARHGLPKLENVYVVHEGPVRRADGDLEESKYSAVPKLPDFEGAKGQAVDSKGDGWIGFTDHYWMTTLIPEQGKPFTEVTKYTPDADIYQAEVREPLMTVAPGASASSSIRFFAGAKEWETITAYENQPGWVSRLFGAKADPEKAAIPGFIDSIDWRAEWLVGLGSQSFPPGYAPAGGRLKNPREGLIPPGGAVQLQFNWSRDEAFAHFRNNQLSVDGFNGRWFAYHFEVQCHTDLGGVGTLRYVAR